MSKPMSPRAWTALWIVYLIWGSTYLAIRVVVRTLPPMLGASARWIVAGAILTTLARRGATERPTARQWRDSAIVGGALIVGGNGLVSIAEKNVPSGIAALVIASIPLFFAAFEWIGFRTRPKPVVIAGLVVGFGGIAILARPDASAHVPLTGMVLLVAAASMWAAGSLFARGADLPKRQVAATGMQMLAGGALMVVVGSLRGEWSSFHPSQVSGSSVLGLAYLTVFGSLVAFSSYAWLLRNAKTSIVATYAYVNPLVAVILGGVILDEKVTARMVAGGVLIVAAVATIVAAGSREAGVAAAPEPIDARAAD